jgi:hypothetical protein
MTSKLKLALVLLVTLSATALAQVQPYGQGLPLPWPFPWAKDCPMDWGSLTGTYTLSDSSFDERLEIRISVGRKTEQRFVRVSRFVNGTMVADGRGTIDLEKQSFRVYLRPLHSNFDALWASVRFYFPDDQQLCTQNLVPILTLQAAGGALKGDSQYRLMRY